MGGERQPWPLFTGQPGEHASMKPAFTLRTDCLVSWMYRPTKKFPLVGSWRTWLRPWAKSRAAVVDGGKRLPRHIARVLEQRERLRGIDILDTIIQAFVQLAEPAKTPAPAELHKILMDSAATLAARVAAANAVGSLRDIASIPALLAVSTNEQRETGTLNVRCGCHQEPAVSLTCKCTNPASRRLTSRRCCGP